MSGLNYQGLNKQRPKPDYAGSNLARRAALAEMEWRGAAVRNRVKRDTIPIADRLINACNTLATAKTAVVHTDGSARLRSGGWAAIIRADIATVELHGADRSTTNNRMEMIAAIYAIEALPECCSVEIVSDSQYLVLGATKWLAGWKRAGWKRGIAPLKNADLWQRIDALKANRSIAWRWCRGHASNAENNRADYLANVARNTGALPARFPVVMSP